MKMRYVLKTVVLSVVVLTSYTHVIAQTATNRTTLKGTIKNPQTNSILLRQQGRADTVKLGKEGTFELLIEQNVGNYFTIEHARQNIQLYLLPSDEVEITMSSANLLDATLKGNSSSYCNYLIAKQKADKKMHADHPLYALGNVTGEAYYAMLDSVRTERKTQLEKAKSEHAFIASFTDVENKIYNYQMGYDLIAYKNQMGKMGVTFFPAIIDKFINSLDLNDEKVTYDYYFKSYALNRLATIATQAYYAGTIKTTLHFYELEIDAICSNITSEKNMSVLLSEFMPQLIKDIGTSDLRNIIAKLEVCCKDKKLVGNIKKYASQYEYLYPGKSSPDVAFYDASGKTSKISSYKGKVLYIDCWATWCGPCKREIPYLKTLEEEFHGKNVQFLSVSTDKDVNAWKAFIAKESMGGLQLHQSDVFEETISKQFVVNSIPRFIIIDEAGNIVSSDAPRPSSGEEIRTLLDSLLAD